MRTIDISGLAAIRKHLTKPPWLVGIEGALLVVFYFDDEPPTHPILLAGGILAIVTCVVLLLRKVSIARRLTAVLVAFNILLLALIPFADVPSKAGAFIVGLMAFAVSIYMAAVCAWSPVRAAERSRYWKIAFASERHLTATYAPGGEGWLGGLRRIRLLPVIVWIGLVTLGTTIAIVMKEWLQVEKPQRYAQILTVLLGGGVYVWAKRRSALRGKEVRRIDRRPPVLLLRSFGDDMMGIRGRGPAWATRDLNRSGMTFERMASEQLSPFGPVVAIGRPNESLAPLGAARDYVPDAVWQEEVQQRILESAIVVLLVGTSEGLAWELRRLRDLSQLHKLILLFPPSDDIVTRWQTLLTIDRASAQPVLPQDVRPAQTLALIYADDLTPIVILGGRDEWSYETAVRIAAMLAITTGAETAAA
jgi:hypothetical protein